MGFFHKNGVSLDADQLPAPLDTHELHQAMEVLKMFSLDEMARELYEGRLKAKRDARMWEKEKEDTLEMLFEIRRIQIKTDETRAEIARRQTEIDQLMAQIEQRQTEAEWEAQQELAHRIQLCERLLKQPVTDMDELLQQERQALFTLANRLEQQLIHTP